MKCFRCPSSLKDGPLYRVNAKDEPGVWACEKHIDQTDAVVDEDTRRLARLIAGFSK